ncbi:hypothetical protein PM082_000485 [Marasmius tenuissimus]|nr:hypothetical protein PM082_000485 [Marasmius tenuissimus]
MFWILSVNKITFKKLNDLELVLNNDFSSTNYGRDPIHGKRQANEVDLVSQYEIHIAASSTNCLASGKCIWDADAWPLPKDLAETRHPDGKDGL